MSFKKKFQIIATYFFPTLHLQTAYQKQLLAFSVIVKKFLKGKFQKLSPEMFYKKWYH